MAARLENPLPVALAGIATLAGIIGVLAGAQPRLALIVAFGLAYLALTLSSVAVGTCLLAALTILDAQGIVNVAKPAGAVLALSWLLMLATRRSMTRRAFVAERPLLAYGLMTFIAWVGISAVWAESSSQAITSLSRYLPNALLLPIVFDAVQKRRHVVWLTATFAGAAGITAALGILHPPASEGVSRVGSTFGDANELGSALVVGLAFAGAIALQRTIRLPLRLAAALAAVLCVLAIFLTLSRGGLLAMSAALLAAVVFSGRWRKRALLAAAVVALGAVAYFSLFASLPARERVTNVSGGGTGRIDLWTVGGRMVAANKLQGVGAGNFPIVSVHYLLQPGVTHRADFIITTPKVAHNTYLQIAAELGLPAAALFVGIVLFCLGSAGAAARRFARADDTRMEIIARSVVVAMVGYLTAIFFISEMYSKLLWMLLALGPALLALSPRAAPRDSWRRRRRSARRPVVVARSLGRR